jgi:hypothetical protein
MLTKQEELAVADQANLSDNPMAKARDILFYEWAFDELTTAYLVRKLIDGGMINAKST